VNKTNKKKISKKRTAPQSQPAIAAVAEPAPRKVKTIKLGVDVHLGIYVVVRIIDGGTPQPAQRFTPAEFLVWCAKQLTLAEQVFTCYEAGPFGYTVTVRRYRVGGATHREVARVDRSS
jgi:hypothetical protein